MVRSASKSARRMARICRCSMAAWRRKSIRRRRSPLMALVENVILDDFHLIEEFMHDGVEPVGELRDKRDQKIVGVAKLAPRAIRRRIASADGGHACGR